MPVTHIMINLLQIPARETQSHMNVTLLLHDELTTLYREPYPKRSKIKYHINFVIDYASNLVATYFETTLL